MKSAIMPKNPYREIICLKTQSFRVTFFYKTMIFTTGQIQQKSAGHQYLQDPQGIGPAHFNVKFLKDPIYILHAPRNTKLSSTGLFVAAINNYSSFAFCNLHKILPKYTLP